MPDLPKTKTVFHPVLPGVDSLPTSQKVRASAGPTFGTGIPDKGPRGRTFAKNPLSAPLAFLGSYICISNIPIRFAASSYVVLMYLHITMDMLWRRAADASPCAMAYISSGSIRKRARGGIFCQLVVACWMARRYANPLFPPPTVQSISSFAQCGRLRQTVAIHCIWAVCHASKPLMNPANPMDSTNIPKITHSITNCKDLCKPKLPHRPFDRPYILNPKPYTLTAPQNWSDGSWLSAPSSTMICPGKQIFRCSNLPQSTWAINRGTSRPNSVSARSAASPTT